jgi:hypothetical protein
VPREQALRLAIAAVTDAPIFLNPSTPQGMAYRFLRDDDPLQIDPCTYPSTEQRYALSTFYFATIGENWSISTDWLSVKNECDWFQVTCGGDGFVTDLILSK